MPKQPEEEKPIKIKYQCSCGRVHQHTIEPPELVKSLTASHTASMLDYQNDIDWLKQRVDELEDQIFVLTECEPPEIGPFSVMKNTTIE